MKKERNFNLFYRRLALVGRPIDRTRTLSIGKMECFTADKSLYDIGESDLKELWDPVNFDAPMGDAFSSDPDWNMLLDSQPIVINDRMFTDAAQSPRIQSEHSYSLSANDDLVPGSPMSIHDKYNTCKLEDFGKDLESECFPTIPMSTTTSSCPAEVHIKQEPLSAPCSPEASIASSSPFSCYNSPSPPPLNHLHSHMDTQQQHHSLNNTTNNHFHHFNRSCSSTAGNDSLVTHSTQAAAPLKQPTIVLATNRSAQKNCRQMYPKVKMETSSGDMNGFQLPPTPPSSHSSDSEGSLSPLYSRQPSSPPALSPPSCPISLNTSTRKHGPQTRMLTSSSNCNQLTNGIIPSSSSTTQLSSSSSSYKNSACTTTSLISSQPKGATGMLMLTEEEKRTLIAEGYPIPTRLPLTKAEEKSLKKIRRKIKNKISAQESRRKKKEYMDALEKKVENLSNENGDFKRRIENLNENNKSLQMQLLELQALLGDVAAPSPCKMSKHTQTSGATWPKRSLKCVKS